jgi:hypothetical protein
VIVIEVVARLAALLTENVTVLAVFVELGEKAAETPLGKPEADSATVLLNPPVGLTVIVLETLPPCFTDTLAGAAEIEKLGAFTISDTEALALL